jgi:hypothetical protein
MCSRRERDAHEQRKQWQVQPFSLTCWKARDGCREELTQLVFVGKRLENRDFWLENVPQNDTHSSRHPSWALHLRAECASEADTNQSGNLYFRPNYSLFLHFRPRNAFFSQQLLSLNGSANRPNYRSDTLLVKLACSFSSNGIILIGTELVSVCRLLWLTRQSASVQKASPSRSIDPCLQRKMR